MCMYTLHDISSDAMKLCLSDRASEPSHSPLRGPMLVYTHPAEHTSLGVEK